MSAECSAENIPPGYKQTEVGVIPEDWDVEPLRRDVTLLSGQHVLAQHCNTTDDGVPYLTGPADFPNNKIQQTKFTNRPTTLCKAGDILVTVKGSGSGTLIKADACYCISRQLMAIRVKEWDTKFLFYSLLQNASKIKISSAGLIPGLSRSDILDQEIPIPRSLSEQEAIAEALSDADAIIESLEQLIAKKRQIKQGAMQELLTGKRRLSGFAIQNGYKNTEVGLIPEDWECVTIGNFIDLLIGFPFPSIGYSKSGVRLLRGSNVKRDFTDWSEEGTEFWPAITSEIRKYALKAGDIVVAMDGSLVGRSFAMLSESDVPAVLLQRVARIRSDFIEQKFLKAWICSQRFTEHCDSVKTVTAIPHISPADIKSFKIALPPTKAEQVAVSTILSDMDSEITALEEKLAKAHQLKQGMMQELLTGRIRLI